MAEFNVTIDQLKNVADQLQQLNAQFRSQKERLAETNGTLNTMWEGEAKQKFQSAFQSDQVQMQNFYNAIVAYVNALNAIIANYINAENTAIDISTTRSYK